MVCFTRYSNPTGSIERKAIVLFPRIGCCLSENSVTTLSQASKNTPINLQARGHFIYRF